MLGLICLVISLTQLLFMHLKKKYRSWKMELVWLFTLLLNMIILVALFLDMIFGWGY